MIILWSNYNSKHQKVYNIVRKLYFDYEKLYSAKSFESNNASDMTKQFKVHFHFHFKWAFFAKPDGQKLNSQIKGLKYVETKLA